MQETRKILIVEDEARVAFFLQENLQALDPAYRVVRAASGEDALSELAHTPFDLVISDFRMPGISGLELLRQVHEQYPTTQTILITAYGSDEVEAETRQLQAYRYYTKPFRMEDFVVGVREALTNMPQRNWGMTSLGERFDKATQRLSDLRYEVGAQCIILFDRLDRIVTQVGFTENLQPPQLAPLVGSALTRSAALAEHLREDRSFNLHYHEGTRYDIYTTNVTDQLFITLIFDRRQGASRVGMVWLYAKRAVQDLQALLASGNSFARPSNANSS